MNCKPGDLAVIVRTHPGTPHTKQFLGRMVRITSLSERHVEEHCWNYEGMPLRGRWNGAFVDWFALPDDWLRPIRPHGDEEEDQRFAPKPEEVTA